MLVAALLLVAGATVPPDHTRTEGPLADGPTAATSCGPAPGLRLRPTLRNPDIDVFEAPDLNPWPGLTPGDDNAAWARVAQSLRQGQLPPPGSARAEEVVAALPTDDPPPPLGDDLIVRAESAFSPWDPNTALVRIAVTTRRPRPLDRGPVNLAVVIDAGADTDTGLATARVSLEEIVSALRDDDTLAIVDSGAQTLLAPTPIADGAGGPGGDRPSDPEPDPQSPDRARPRVPAPRADGRGAAGGAGVGRRSVAHRAGRRAGGAGRDPGRGRGEPRGGRVRRSPRSGRGGRVAGAGGGRDLPSTSAARTTPGGCSGTTWRRWSSRW